MDTSLHFRPNHPLVQPSSTLSEPQDLLDFYPGDERNRQATTGAGHIDQSTTPAASAAAVHAQ